MYTSPTSVKLPGFFVFWWSYEDAAKVQRDCAVCFKAPGEVQVSAWVDLIEEVSKGPELPDAVILMYLRQDALNFQKGRGDQNVAVSLSRFEKRFPYFEVELDLKGEPTTTKAFGKFAASQDELEWIDRVKKNLPSMLQAGLDRIFCADHVIIEAPPGFEFIKHGNGNQKRSRTFLRAEQALTDTAVVSFVALCIWHRILGGRVGGVPEFRAIFIDTMGISPVAFALREFFNLAGLGVLPQVESFHSYGGMDKVRVTDKGHALCLVSASTSMDMHHNWVRSKGVEPSQVLTFVTRLEADSSRYALVTLNDKRLSSEYSRSAVSAPYSIRIKGETFLPDLEGAKAVTIGLKHSLFERDSRYQAEARAQASLYKCQELLVHGSAADSNPTYKPIFVDAVKIADNKGISSALTELIDQFGFAKAKWVLYQDDPGSKTLALKVAEHSGVQMSSVLSAADVASAADFGNEPMVIVGAVVGQGSQLVGISRDLRGKHKGNRLYLAAIHIPSTFAAKDMLSRNLEKTKPGEGTYRFRAFCSLPTGVTGSAAFVAEKVLYDRFPGVVWPESIKARFEAISKSRVTAPAFGFLPTGVDLDGSLTLREGFTFWTSQYEEGPWTSAVLWVIGATLQRAREDTSLPDGLQLRSTALGQVFLDPENFTRYNDGIIQAAILRVALEHEIDYRGQVEASDRMRRFLIRLFRSISDRNSEAILEFLVSIACQRLRLEPDHLHQFIVQAVAYLEQQPPSPLKEAIKCFLHVISTIYDAGPPELRVEERPF